MDRLQKQEVVSDLRNILQTVSSVIVTRNDGLTAMEMTNLRRQMRADGATLRVAKNKLVSFALEGSACEGIRDFLVGPTALAYSVDPVAAARVVDAFVKTNDKLVILGGVVGGKVISASDVQALAKLPTLDEIRGQLVGLVQSLGSKIYNVLQEPAGQLTRLIHARSEQG